MRRNRSTILAGALLSSAVFLFFLRDRGVGHFFHDPSAFIEGLRSLQSRGGARGPVESSRYPQTRLRTAEREMPEVKILWPHRGLPGPTFDTVADILIGTGEDDAIWIAEWKYDGERFQVHNDGNGGIELFSLSGDNVTERHLDLVCELRDALEDASVPCVLEGEVVAFSTTDGYEFDLKTLLRRSRALQRGKTPAIPVRARLFDCLFYNEEDLTSQAKEDRFRVLQEVLKDEVVNSDEPYSRVKLGQRMELDSGRLSESLEETFRKATMEPSIRGVVVKNRLSSYQTRNGSQWMTIRRNDHQVTAGSDAVDAVAVGLKKGERMGQRTEKVVFLVALRKEEGEGESAAESESSPEGPPTAEPAEPE